MMHTGFHKHTRGFTLMEMVISCAIIAVISTVIIFNHKKFNDNLEITNLSYEVALAIRQAQVYGVSTKEFRDSTATEEERFGLGYGISFNQDVSDTSFVFFADRNKNGRYNGSYTNCLNGAPDACLGITHIGRGNKIHAICEPSGNGNNWQCNGDPHDEAHITFVRPEPDAILKLKNGPDPAVIKICLISPQGKIREIDVFTTGQISLDDGNCSEASSTIGDNLLSDGNGNGGNDGISGVGDPGGGPGNR